MGRYHIIGGSKICGEVKINGAKNSVLPILASTILNKGISVVRNCPRISDTFIAVEILESLGCNVIYEGTTITVDSRNLDNLEIPEHLIRSMRSSILFLGGLLGRFNEVKIGYPGGCELGLRPIDLHIKGIKKLGADVIDEHGFIVCTAKELIGTHINLDFPSVGATENLMIASVLAHGETIISNSAKEPEVVDLENFLNGMGANIKGAGTDTIYIKGVKKLHDVDHTVIPDRIVAGTYLIASAISNGEILLENVDTDSLSIVTSKLTETGCTIKSYNNKIHLKAPNTLLSIDKFLTHPHPGFPTDIQPMFVTLLSLAEGVSTVTETVFESRNKHISELSRMGADISLSRDGMTFFINGVKKLYGTTVAAKDLRGGASLILAGLVAEGETIVTDSIHVERGYEDIEIVLSSLGANIRFAK
jgi:UDP-N-acetylglucosamine 1-carboxyvinyltransferase